MAAPDTGVGVLYVKPSDRAAVENRNRELNTKSVPELPDMIQQLSEEKALFIFNVGPWPHTVFSNYGRMYIPACPEGKEHSEALKIPGVPSMPYPDSESSMKLHLEKGGGEYLAQQILGIGPHMHPGNSLLRYGVFVAKQWPPTKEEIQKAKDALYKGELTSLVSEADQAAAEGPKASENTIRDRHQTAARMLKLSVADHPWMGRFQGASMARTECKFCGEPMKAGLPKCPNCKEVVDQAAYDRMKGKAKE